MGIRSLNHPFVLESRKPQKKVKIPCQCVWMGPVSRKVSKDINVVQPLPGRSKPGISN